MLDVDGPTYRALRRIGNDSRLSASYVAQILLHESIETCDGIIEQSDGSFALLCQNESRPLSVSSVVGVVCVCLASLSAGCLTGFCLGH